MGSVPPRPPPSKSVITRRPCPEQLSWLKKSALPPHHPRPIENVMKDAQDIFSYGFNVGHSRFFSCVPSPASKVSWLGDAMTSAFNPFGGSLEAGTGVCTVESSLIEWIAQRFGLPTSAGGHFVSGASMATLTAIIVARDQILGECEARRSKGIAYISDQTHFSVRKALRIIGIPLGNVRVIPSDAGFRMNPDKLSETILEDIRDGRRPFLVVGTCGTTGSGAIDPLYEIGKTTRLHNIWLHVDAAYGGSVAFSSTHCSLVSGLSNADSIAWDAHKWLFQTHGCGAVVFRDATTALSSFKTPTAHFLVDLDKGEDLPDLWNYGIELTRPARHMRLWFSLQALGMERIDQMISRGFHLSKLAERELSKLLGWKIISPATMGIVNFRFMPEGEPAPYMDIVNGRISKDLIDKNIAVILTSRLTGVVSLRMCTINPETTDEDIKDVVHALDEAAQLHYTPSGYIRSKL
ncbi:pyridoxal phosphate-dependent transferase [Penicillium cataractarum]|uniref:Pyridoxal phosphate-dependent transferase n=1 Tax=Penicillium cataractarum TaxID=2100454 RepID=A0A9X0B5W9_9EURO|nr:pyridoxal phosphate-dependent transferase [Penicillium cataractarum]KAJ5389344.1 pyridoxal phosphate-dependent transferase [Penicillium cataractarum]